MLHMQWEVKWYQYVQNSLLPDFVVKNNRTGNSPDKIFQAEHRELEDESKQWLNSTSNSCSFIAALIATVAFASTASVPGGLQWQNNTSNPGSFIYFCNSTASCSFLFSDLLANILRHFHLQGRRQRFYYKLAEEIFIWFNISLYIHSSHVDLFLLGRLLDA
ncbi:unnamed protein product, partial [Vitis vinifera]|uniref:PGG domain-containing protein n=1 Tax=Vitis vinifera TaxID=29760 RepID=D7U6M1_VITVI